ncbi:hypothetical protein [Shewanella youngdeokensis]|uniref:Sulfotransferase domain-containing protein n=1 Tax=Shewanella youngdeokensis TaxID=2999068 RepID=A0ABZ0K3A1_9GAMM|nr:hypothetical protein RGE70_05845 [Shewanella sp. DAU334]
MSKKVVIHAGPGKTGTSAIQFWLKNNTPELRKHAIFYPDHLLDNNGVSCGNLQAILTRDESGKCYLDPNKTSILLDDFLASSNQVLLLSSEFFFYEIEALHQAIQPHIEVEFIVYLRDPVEQIESGHNQGVKRHRVKSELHIPLDFRFAQIDYLEQILASNKRIKLNIRPYDVTLFHGGSILSDLLYEIGCNAKVPHVARVNQSYCYQAHEFKRIANHFPIDNFESKLDKILQSYQGETPVFSKIKPERYSDLKQSVTSRLERFVDAHSELNYLSTWVDIVKLSPQKPYTERALTQEELQSVVEYIKQQSLAVFELLKHCIAKHPDLLLPNEHFYQCFNVVPEKSTEITGIDNYTLLAKKLLSNKNGQSADVLREVALHFERCGDLGNAQKFMEVAHRLRPNGGYIRLKLNDYRIAKIELNEASGNKYMRMLSNKLKYFNPFK